jgi:hypothetical protein
MWPDGWRLSSGTSEEGDGVLCENCHGKGVILIAGAPHPCPECGGLGLLHCCEGLQAQPERCKEDRGAGKQEAEDG